METEVEKKVKYLQIKSKGEMALEALSLIGASTKKGNKKVIGFFGSGLKYSISAMLRQKIRFLIFSGVKQIEVTTEKKVFGGIEFNQIFLNGKETSLTDSMGGNDWDGAWPFIREIYSNALDEGEATLTVVEADDVIPEDGYTTYFMQINPDIEEIINNFSQYFVTRSKHVYADKGSNYLHSPGGKGLRIYRKGIIVYHEKDTKAEFHYDLDKAQINESRVLNSVWGAQDIIGKMFESCTDEAIIIQFMQGLSKANAGTFEHSCILSSYAESSASSEFIKYCRKGKFYPVEIEFMLEPSEKEGRLSLPLDILKRMLKACSTCDILGLTTGEDGQSEHMYVLVDKPEEALTVKIDEALDILKNTTYRSRLTFDIKVCKFKGQNIRGRFHNERCLLSTKLELNSAEEIATIIIEEMEHGHTGYEDKTRSFQNHLFKLFFGALVNKGERKKIKLLEKKVENQDALIDKYAKLGWVGRAFVNIK